MFNERERAMILAGLAMADVGLPSIFLGIASDGGRFEPLGSAEINDLAARIQFGERPTVKEPVTVDPAADHGGLFSGHFLNSYECDCGESWQEEADSMCNDRCPGCNREIQPCDSQELSTPDQETPENDA